MFFGSSVHLCFSCLGWLHWHLPSSKKQSSQGRFSQALKIYPTDLRLILRLQTSLSHKKAVGVVSLWVSSTHNSEVCFGSFWRGGSPLRDCPLVAQVFGTFLKGFDHSGLHEHPLMTPNFQVQRLYKRSVAPNYHNSSLFPVHAGGGTRCWQKWNEQEL